MFKPFACLILVAIMMSVHADDSQTEIMIKVKNKTSGTVSTATEKPRKYPEYKTEQGVLKGYARAWSTLDYDLAYHLLSSNARDEWTFSKFKRLLQDDAGRNGGLAGFENPKRLAGSNYKSIWQLTMIYKNSSAGGKTVRATLVKEGGFWFVSDGGIMPPDLSMFDR